jgi:hypothetical protein
MEKYWKILNQPQAPTEVTTGDTAADTASGSTSVLSEYGRYRLTLMSENEGWESELRRYEKDMPLDVSPDTDIVMWWQVCLQYIFPVSHILFTLPGPLPHLPHSRTHCARYSPYPSLVCTMRATLLGSKRNRG